MNREEILLLEERRDYAAIKRLLDGMNAVDIAEQLDELDAQNAVRVFRMLGKDNAADVFAYLSREVRQRIVEAISDKEITGIINDLFLDDAVDFIEEMPASVVKRVLSSVPAEKRDMINQFLQYPEDSAGSIMTIEYVELKSGLTVSEAFSHIRRTGVDKETIYTCYVIDPNRKLIGQVSARALLLADGDAPVRELMDTDLEYAHTIDDRESLALTFRRYGLLALPVVDNENRLVGIVTVDDVLEVQEQEATEDFEIMAAMSPSEGPYLKTGVITLMRKRVFWLLLLMMSATLTGMVITSFENALAVVPALIAFIPMLMNTGGNAGSQSSTMIIRGMALGEIEPADIARVLWKEVRVAVLCGAALAVVNFFRILLTGREAPMAFTVSAALYLTVILATAFGSMLPIAAKLLRLDPAVMAAPAITTFVDTLSLILFFSLARVILSI